MPSTHDPSSAPHGTPRVDAEDLLAYLAASPSPFHAVEESGRRLSAAGFTPLDGSAADPGAPGGHLVARDGALLAWWIPTGVPRGPLGGPAASGAGGEDDTGGAAFRIVGAHTDSPNLRIKPRPDSGRSGFRQLGVEVYGGPLRNSWLDRDLGISGRVVVRDDRGEQVRLLRVDEPVLRIPQLAIHLDRGVNEEGLKLNPQAHLEPIWGLGEPTEGGFASYLADQLGVSSDAVVAWDLMVHDLTPPAIVGVDRSLVASARIDDQLSCWAGTEALVRASRDPDPTTIAVLALFDHEEIGSRSATGASSALLPKLLERIGRSLDWDAEAQAVVIERSICISADGAHATHPNYADRHEPNHRISIDGGPVIKHNANVRYATDAPGAAAVRRCGAAAGVPIQEFVVRSDMACGSTIGPDTAAVTGVRTVDVGVAQLAMHSARETCGRRDAERFVELLTVFLGGS